MYKPPQQWLVEDYGNVRKWDEGDQGWCASRRPLVLSGQQQLPVEPKLQLLDIDASALVQKQLERTMSYRLASPDLH